MTAEETVAWEYDQRRWAVPAAAVAGILPLAGAVISLILFRHAPNNRPGALLYTYDHPAGLIVSGALLAVGACGLAAALAYLSRAVRARETPAIRRVPRFLPYLIGIGA